MPEGPAAPAAASRSSIDLDGLTFGALSWGPEDGPPALLVHGFPDTAWTWRTVGPLLGEAGWRAVAPFTRGYGPTGLAPDDRYFVADQVSDILGLADRLGGEGGHAVLVGHDWGAVVAWAVASHYPERFDSIVAMSVPPPEILRQVWLSPRTIPTGLGQLRLSWYFLFNQLGLAERRFDDLVHRLWRDWSPDFDPTEDLELLKGSLSTPERVRASLEYYRDNLRHGIGYLAGLRPVAPVLYLHGTEDGCGSVGLARIGSGSMADGSVFEEVPGAGHFLQLEDPERVAELILAWIGRPAQGA